MLPRDWNFEKYPEILELKNSVNKIKNVLESIWNWTDHMKERISKLEDKNLKIIQVEGRENYF